MTEHLLTAKLSQLAAAASSVEALLAGLPRSKRPELDLFECSKTLRSAQNTLEAAALDLAGAANGSLPAATKAEFTAALRDHKRSLKELKNAYERARIAADRKTLVEGATPSATAAASASASSSAMMSHGLRVQQRDMTSLTNMVRVIHEAKEIGIDVNEKLEAQTGQIAGVHGQQISQQRGTQASSVDRSDRSLVRFCLLSPVCRSTRVYRFHSCSLHEGDQAHLATHCVGQVSARSSFFCGSTLVSDTQRSHTRVLRAIRRRGRNLG